MNEEEFNLRVSSINSTIGIMSAENFEGASAETAFRIMDKVYDFLSQAKESKTGNVLTLNLGD